MQHVFRLKKKLYRGFSLCLTTRGNVCCARCGSASASINKQARGENFEHIILHGSAAYTYAGSSDQYAKFLNEKIATLSTPLSKSSFSSPHLGIKEKK